MGGIAHRSLKPGSLDLQYGRKYVWEFPVRLCHWMTVLAVSTLFASGLYINQPELAPSGEPVRNFLMGRVREIHFVAGYVMLASFLLRIYWFYMGNNYARSGFPFVWQRQWWTDVRKQAWQYLSLERGHVHLGHNALAGLAYTTFVIGLGLCQMLTGFALYSESNRGGFWDTLTGWIFPLCGGSWNVRMWHHTMAWGFVVFVILHLYIVLFDDRQYRNGLISSMVAGFKFYEKDDLDHDRWLS